MSFPRYPAYKPSGVEWLGEVPEHWTLAPLKKLLDIQNGSDYKAVETEDGYPVIGSGGPFAFASQYHYDGESVLLGRKGTIDRPLYVMERFWAVDTMYWSKIRDGAHGRFAFYTSQCIPFQYYSTNTALPSMTKSLLGSHIIAVPCETEQGSIATFLDHETAKIDALIAEQQRLIELLQEKRQAVISRAVTKGLNPDVPMKDSGVEWLGEVPEHWTVTQLRHFSKSLPGFAFSSDGFIQDESKWKLLRGVNVGVSCIRWDETVYWDRQVDDRLDQYVLSPGDLVVGLDRPMIKEGLRVARIAQEDCPCMLLQRVAAVKGSKNLSNDYLFFLLSSPYFLAHFEPETTGVSVPHISTGQIDSFVVPIPPPEEQAEVVAFLSAELKAIQRLTEESSWSISLLQELRSALISAAVTGQIDVRGLVAEAEVS